MQELPKGLADVVANERGMTILEEAEEAVNGPRRTYYGHPKRNHGLTAQLWSAYLGVEIDAEMVCYMNILQKVSRSRCSTTRDTLVDIAGFARNIEIIGEEL